VDSVAGLFRQSTLPSRILQATRYVLTARGRGAMSDVAQSASEIPGPEEMTSDQLLPLVYGKLRRLASLWLVRETLGQTMQVTELVHEAYVRMVSGSRKQYWDSVGHFFSAAATAMRRILVEKARRKASLKRGTGWTRVEIEPCSSPPPGSPLNLVMLDEALTRLSVEHERKARVVELMFFSGLSVEEAAVVLGISTATAYRDWTYARAWLHREMFHEVT
jgi:RNA polymerase sigma factor (TIGR02999 family)